MPVKTNIEKELEEMYNKKKKEDEKNSTSSFESFSNEEKLILPVGDTVCRLLEIPRQCESSWIKCDDGKKRLFKFPLLDEDPNFLLYKIINTILAQKWEGTDNTGKAIITVPWKEKEPEIYWMVYNNESEILGDYGAEGWGKWTKRDGKYQGAASSRTCFVNVINRREFEVTKTKKGKDNENIEEIVKYSKTWCVENKHSLLLSKTLSSVGAPITIYNLLMSDIFPNYGNFQKYDIAIHRMKKDPYYNLKKAEDCKQNKEVFPYVITGDLTEEEKAIDLYDIVELSKPATYTYIYKYLKGKVGTIDDALGTHFLDELEELASKENDDSVVVTPRTSKESSNSESVKNDTKEESKEDTKKESKVENKKESKTESDTKKESPSRQVRQDKVEKDEPSDTDESYSFADAVGAFPAIEKLTEEEKKYIKGIKIVGEETIVIFDSDDMVSCPYCKKDQPNPISTCCIYCGTSF